MENSVSTESVLAPYSYASSALQSKYELNSLIVQSTLVSSDQSSSDSSVIDINRVTQGISLTSEQILEKLNELLKDRVPAGLESLKPEDYTPEKTATSVVDSITALFTSFEKSNPDLSPDEVITRFIKAARAGVDAGYDDAYQTLDGLGAFGFDQVKSGVEQTKILIVEKLAAFEAAKRKELGTAESEIIAENTATALKTQAGVRVAA